MRRPIKPMNSSIAQQANDTFFQHHPELIKDGTRLLLHPSDPCQAALRKEWMDLYVNCGGAVEKVNVNAKQKKLIEKEQSAEKYKSQDAYNVVVPCAATQCSIDVLTITRADKYMLSIPSEPTRDSNYVLQILAGHTDNFAKTVNIEIAGSCKKDKNEVCPSLSIRGGHINEQGQGKLDVKLKGHQPPSGVFYKKEIGLAYYLTEIIWPANTTTETYCITTKLCPGGTIYTVVIEAFNPVGWKGNGYVTYIPANKDKGTDGKWDIGGGIEITYDKYSKKLSKDVKLPVDAKGKDLGWVLNTANTIVEKLKILGQINDFLDTAAGIELLNTKDKEGNKLYKFDPKWPKLTIDGGLCNAEMASNYRVGTEGTATIALAPFLGCDVKINILQMIIEGVLKLTPAGHTVDAVVTAIKFLKKVAANAEEAAKKQAKEKNQDVGFEADAVLELQISGDISGEIKCTVSVAKDEYTGTITPKLGFALEGKVFIEGHWFFIEAGAGLGVALKSAASYKEKSEFKGELKAQTLNKFLDFDGELTYNGLALYTMAYAYARFKSMSDEKGGGRGIESRNALDLAAGEKKWEKIAVLIKPWPEVQS